MTKKAVLLASLRAKAPILLFAARKLTTASVSTANYANHKCTACNTEVAFGSPIDGVEPFCPACGSTAVPTGEVVQVAPQEDTLTSVGCPHCATANVVEDRTLAALGGDMHCAACGNGISYKATAASDVEDQLDTEELDVQAITPELRSDNTGETPQSPTLQPETAGDTPEEVVEDAQAIAKGIANGADAVADALQQHVDGGNDPAAYGEEDLDADGGLEVDMADAANDDGEVDIKLDEDSETARLLAFVDGTHVMTLEKANAGDNADLIANTKFHQSLQREATKSGFKVLSSYGFQGVKVTLPINRLVEKKVQAALAAEKALVEAASTDLKVNFDQCAKIAAAALTQNFYKNRTNPLQDQLTATLQGMGVKQAKQIVGRAMVQAGPQFVTAMLELATELMDKSVESRNELSDTLSQINPDAAVSMEEDIEDMSDMNTAPDAIMARLSTGVIEKPQASRKARTTQTAAADASSPGARLRQLKNLG